MVLKRARRSNAAVGVSLIRPGEKKGSFHNSYLVGLPDGTSYVTDKQFFKDSNWEDGLVDRGDKRPIVSLKGLAIKFFICVEADTKYFYQAKSALEMYHRPFSDLMISGAWASTLAISRVKLVGSSDW